MNFLLSLEFDALTKELEIQKLEIQLSEKKIKEAGLQIEAKDVVLKEAEQKYIIPALVREKFPDLVKLIYETESMNDEEREYWLQIMPIMTEEQIVKFREILVNEKDQLSKLDNEYEQEMGRIDARKTPEIDGAKLKEKMAEIKQKETVREEAEVAEEEELLKKLEGI